jgi:UDP-glucuronate decarboxylase
MSGEHGRVGSKTRPEDATGPSERRLLVTGAAGFIGARLVTQALERGWQVIALLQPSDDEGALGPALEQVRVVRGSLGDDEDPWHAEMARLAPTSCAHLAWITTPGVYLDSRENLNLMNWSAKLFSRLPEWGCKHIVGVGTCAEYDASHGYLREETPTLPLTLYAAAKSSLRLLGQQLAAQSGVEFSWVRIFSSFGPSEDERRLIPAGILALLLGSSFQASAGTQVRDFLHVDDVAGGLLSVLEARYQGDVNICSGRPVQVREVLALIERLTGRQGALQLGARPSRIWEPPFICGDNGRLISLGWQQRYSLETGIEAAVDWWRHHLAGRERNRAMSS